MTRRRTVLPTAVLALTVALTACGGGGRGSSHPGASTTVPTASGEGSGSAGGVPTTGAAVSGPCGSVPTAPTTYQHVVWIWMENHETGEVIGKGAAPYVSSLARRCATATRYGDVGHPSLPNYIGATSGGTQGIGDDAAPSSHQLAADNLFRQVRVSGRTERSYQESMPDNCVRSSSDRYAVKHNPAAYYVGDGDRAACQADDVPMGTTTGGAFLDDLTRGTLPAFSFVTPDLCNDTHDCPVATGDRWLADWVPRILSSSAYRSGTTVVFLVWDEPTPMPFVVIAPSVHPGTVVDAAVDHYALLRTTEEALGLGNFLGRAASAPSLRPLFGV